MARLKLYSGVNWSCGKRRQKTKPLEDYELRAGIWLMKYWNS